MKFFVAILLVAFVALASAADEPARKLEPVKEFEPSSENVADPANARNKRGFVLSAYSAPLTAAVEVAAPLTAAAPVAYTYTAGYPYAYSAYRAYAPYYSYPAVYY